MAPVATIQSASAPAAPSAKGSAQAADTGFMDALDAILQADGATLQAASTVGKPIAQTAAAPASGEADTETSSNPSEEDAGVDDINATVVTAAPSVPEAKAAITAPTDAGTAAAGAIAATTNASLQTTIVQASSAATSLDAAPLAVTLPKQAIAQAKADASAPATGTAILKRPTSLVFAQAGTIDPASEDKGSEISAADASAASAPLNPAASSSALLSPSIAVVASVVAPAAAVSTAKLPLVAPDASSVPANTAAASATLPKTAAGSTLTGPKTAVKQVSIPSVESTTQIPAAASPASLANAASQAGTQVANSQPVQTTQVSTSDRSVSAVGAAPRTAAAGAVQNTPAASASALDQARPIVAEDVAASAVAGKDQSISPAAAQVVKPGSSQSANDDQTVDVDTSAQDLPPVSAKPDQAASSDASVSAGKIKTAVETAGVSAQVKTADVTAAPLLATSIATAPASNTQEAGKLVLNGITGQTPADQVSVAIHTAAIDKASSVTIALNPAELGKVEVKLDFAHDGSVQANIIAERADTLQILRNDHQALHQALNNAGLSTDASSLNFSLGSDRQNQQASQGNNTPYASRTTFTAETLVETPASALTTRSVAVDGRVDMLV